jgi:protein involved in sex pheromone biosynthesis
VRAERRSLLLSEDKEDVEERGEQEVKAYDDSLQKLWESFRNVQRQAEEKELEFVPLDIDEPVPFWTKLA